MHTHYPPIAHRLALRPIRPRSVIVILIAVWAVYLGLLWPWLNRWGATDAELAMPLPGDELAPVATSTRAITIAAPAGEVWQWLVQVGQDRAGFYSYEWLGNLVGVNYQHAE